MPFMPYTFAHIGYILLLKKKWKEKFSITGLVFGSLAPDYDILFRFTENRFHIFQYDFRCVLLHIFPLALLSAFGFHLFSRNLLIQNLPDTLEKRYRHYLSFNFLLYFKQHYWQVSISILFAIYLHLFLDMLCHSIDAYSFKMYIFNIVRNEPLSKTAYIFGIYGLPVLFSLMGFYLIYRYEFNRNFSINIFIPEKEKLPFWFGLAGLTLVLFILKIAFMQVEDFFWIDNLAISLTSAFLLAIYINGFIFSIKQKQVWKP